MLWRPESLLILRILLYNIPLVTIKQQLFIHKYLEFKNATKAVTRVYDVGNKNSAAVIGCRLLRNVKVQEAISRILEIEGSVLSRTIQLLENVSNAGAPLKACQVVLKLYGFL